MTPKTARQWEVAQLSAQLPPLTKEQEEWAQTHCFDRIAHLCKKKAWCSMCGHEFDEAHESPLSVTLLGGHVECPNCGAKLGLKNSRKQKLEERWYFQIMTTSGQYQVCRTFVAYKSIRKGQEPHYWAQEAVQNWISPDGKETVMARLCNPVPHCYDSWNFSSRMEIRQPRKKTYGGYYDINKYEIHAEYIYPERRIKPLLRRNGYTAKCDTIPQSVLVKYLYTDHEAEVLAKNGQFGLLKYKNLHGLGEFKMKHQHAIRVAMRHKYIIKDATLWHDYLELLEYFNLDTHNPHYICPDDLKAEHDRLDERKKKIEAQRRREEKIREAAKWEKKYRRDKEKYFGICFGNENVVITVIQSVAAIAEEGEAMHHCVYTAEYFKKKEALILSARTPEGERLETIELNLNTFKVVQSRGKYNNISPLHDEILALMQANIGQIARIKEAA